MAMVKWVVAAVFALAGAYVAWAAASGRTVPFGLSGLAPMWLAVGLGFIACSIGGIGDGLARAGGNWMSPWILLGMALGVAILLAIVGAVTGMRVAGIASASQWVLVVGVLIAAKFALTSAQAATSLLART